MLYLEATPVNYLTLRIKLPASLQHPVNSALLWGLNSQHHCKCNTLLLCLTLRIKLPASVVIYILFFNLQLTIYMRKNIDYPENSLCFVLIINVLFNLLCAGISFAWVLLPVVEKNVVMFWHCNLCYFYYKIHHQWWCMLLMHQTATATEVCIFAITVVVFSSL